MLPRTNRLNLAKEFAIFKRHAVAEKTPLYTVLWKKRDGVSPVRIGFVVSNRLGNAIHRNRTRRLLREAVSHNLTHIPSHIDIILIATPHTEQASVAEIGEQLQKTFLRIGSKITR